VNVACIAGDVLDDAEAFALTAALRRMGLLAAGEAPTLTVLTGGVSSLIVLARTARGPLCVKRALAKLKVDATWFAPVERNRAEVAWMKIAGEIAPTSVPRILGEDAAMMAFAMEWLDPDRYPVWKTQLREGIADVRTARAVGGVVGAIHRATAGKASVERDFAHDAGFYAIRLEPYLEASAQAHPAQAVALRQLIAVTVANRRVLVHGDVSPKNILVGPDGPVVLDAECAWYGDPAFDLAFCLSHLLLKCRWRPASAAAYLACFDALAQSYLHCVDWEPRKQVEGRAARLLAGLLLGRIDGKSPVEYLVDSAVRDRVRQFALRHLATPASRLVTLREHWSEDLNA
jgi:aminoglycoside phosphotransferase (APT) family kinase protein